MKTNPGKDNDTLLEHSSRSAYFKKWFERSASTTPAFFERRTAIEGCVDF
jgi:hypothetical protein